METIDLGSLPHTEAMRVVATGAPVYLMVNPVEYHGPHLPLGNDHNLSLAASRDLHTRIQARHPEWPFVVAQPLHLGVEPAPGKGSAPVKFLTLRKLVINSCRALLNLGVKRIVLMTFHGNPLHNVALQEGVRFVRAQGGSAIAPFNIVLNEMLDYAPGKFDEALKHVADLELREFMRRSLPLDFHAGFFETSLVLHYRPDTVSASHRELPPCPAIQPNVPFGLLGAVAQRLGRTKLAAECRFVSFGMGWMKLNPCPGYTGWPHVASAEAGAAFADAIMARYVPRALEALESGADSPRPILRWLVPLSLNGRVLP